MLGDLDPLDVRLLDGWQRNLPLTPRPFAAIAQAEGSSEAVILGRLRHLSEIGAISRVGATCRPNTLAASTLAAVAAQEGQIEEVAAIIGAEAGVNHSYLREDRWNIWFVATGPDREHVSRTIARIGQYTGLRVLDLPLVRSFNVDLGFAFDGGRRPMSEARPADPSTIEPGDRAVMQALSEGLDLVERPFRALAERVGRTERQVIERIADLSRSGIITRLGVIVRHRALGWRSNAMVVWSLPDALVDRAGEELANVRGVTLCYRRRMDPDFWPYPLYCMIHARSRPEAMRVLAEARKIEGLARAPHKVLFSLHCFKQRGALISGKGGMAA